MKNEQPAATPAMMTIEEVSKRLNISASFVYTTVADGRLKHYRLGRGQGGIRVSEQQLAAYLAGTERGGKPKEAPKRRYKHLT